MQRLDAKQIEWAASNVENWEATRRYIKSYNADQLYTLLSYEVLHRVPPRPYVFQRIFSRYWKLKGKQVNVACKSIMQRRMENAEKNFRT